MKIIFTPIVAVVLLISCATKEPKIVTVDTKKEILEADLAFSEMSKAKGMRAAFMEYIDSNGVLLRPNTLPLVGGQAIDYISQENDSSYSMVWEPQGALVAKSGDLGFTYGVYALTIKGKDSVKYGTYTSIWKKQADGKWKFVLDTGNDGIGQ